MVKINLALQGGGAHGAFTWGVLDRLLAEDDIEIAAISGASAGALNGAALKSGWLMGGANGARENLNWLWSQMGALSDPVMAKWLNDIMPNSAVLSSLMENSLPYMMADTVSRMSSPYATGALWKNPLRPLAEAFHYEKIRAYEGPQLFVGATNVRTGKIRIFTREDISTDALLASACLPTIFQAVEIEDPKTGAIEAYWDGGYTGNPALFPLFAPELPDDIVVVNINPLVRDEIPKTPQQIQNRVNEISFNSSLLRELRAIGFVQRLLADGALQPGTMKNVKIHMIADDQMMNDLSVSTKIIPNPAVLDRLKEAGINAADAFLKNHKSDIGVQSSVDLAAMVD